MKIWALTLALVLSVVSVVADQGRRGRGGPQIRVGGGTPAGGGGPAATCGGTDVSMWDHPRLIVCGDRRTQIMSDMDGARETEFNSLLAAIETDWASIGSSYDLNVLVTLAFVLNTWHTGPNYNGRSEADFQAKFLGTLDAGFALGLINICGASEMQVPAMALAYDWTVWTGILDGTRSGASTTRKVEASDCLKTWASGSTSGPLHHRHGPYRMNEIWYGLAFANDGIDNTTANTRLGLYSTYITATDTGYLDLFNFAGGTDGIYPDGFGYSSANTETDPSFFEHLLFFSAYQTAYGDADIFTTGFDGSLEYYAIPVAYFLAPYTANVDAASCVALDFKTSQTQPYCWDGTYAAHTGGWPLTLQGIIMHYPASLDSVKLAEWVLNNYLPAAGFTSGCGGYPRCWGKQWGWWGFVTNNAASVTASSPSTLGLPLSRKFTQYGVVSMRTGWTDTDDSLLTCMGWKWQIVGGVDYGLHGNGHCQLSRGAPLLIKNGAGVHHVIEETSAGSNVANFVDPSESAPGAGVWDKGGQREGNMIGYPDSVADYVTNSQYDMGGFSLTDLYTAGGTHNYDYLWGDFTTSYNSTPENDGNNTVKVDQYTREVVFLRASSRTGIDLFCAADSGKTEGSPTITGHSGTTTTTRGGHSHTVYLDATNLSFQYSGVSMSSAPLFGHFLFPTDSDIVHRGGPNGSSVWWQTDSHEFENNIGEQFGPGAGGAGSEVTWYYPWAGQYTIDHVNGAAAAQVVHFVSCWEATPQGTSSASTITATTGTGTMVIQDDGNNRGWVTKTTFGTMGTGYDFALPASDTTQRLVTRLPASTSISFTKGSDITSVKNIANGVTETGSTFSFTSNSSGVLLLEFVTGSGANRTLSW